MKPKAGQSKDDFISECIPLVLEDGTAENDDQALAVCSSMWETGRSQRESRVFTLGELRAEDGGLETNDPIIEGYIAKFNVWSEDLGGFIERLIPGAFSKTIREADIRALWQHNPEMVLGRTKNGTLTLVEDDVGLFMRAFPPNTTWARDAVTSIKRGDVDQASFGFDAIRDQWDWNAKPVTRDLIEVALFDVSPVTFPAYPQTTMAVRQLLRDHAGAPGQELHPPVMDAEQDSARARVALRRKQIELLERYFI